MHCWEITKAHTDATTIINVVASFLSVIGSLATIVSFLLSREKRQPLNQYIFCLSITDFVATGTILITQGITQFKPLANTLPFCISTRAIVEMFFVSSFCWTTSIAIHMYRAINQLPAYKAVYIMFHVISWGLPLILVIIELSGGLIGRASNASWCNLEGRYEWGLWFGPMIASVFINLIIYVLILRSFKMKMKRQSTSLQRRNETDVMRRLSLCLLAFFVCWIWNVIGHIITEVRPKCAIYPLWVLQDFFSPLQGFLNFIVYGMSNRMIRSCFKKKFTTYREYSSNRLEEQPLRAPVSPGFSSVNSY